MEEQKEPEAIVSTATLVARQWTSGLSDRERLELHRWAQELLDVRNSDAPLHRKVQAALRATAHAEVARPLVMQFGRQARELGLRSKELLWDERSWAARIGLLGVSAGAGAFGAQGAGIAALGGAIGVPLWLVIGAGGAFLGALVDELGRVAKTGTSRASAGGVVVARAPAAGPQRDATRSELRGAASPKRPGGATRRRSPSKRRARRPRA